MYLRADAEYAFDRMSHAYAKAFHDATLTTIPACGHFAEMEKPDVVANLATDFLSRN